MAGSGSFLFAVTVAIFAVVAFFGGFFDRPSFDYSDRLLVSTDATELYALVAPLTEKNYGHHVERIMTGTLDAITSSVNYGDELLKAAAVTYGAPKGTEKVSVGMYFDNPSKTDNPRWAMGWVLDPQAVGGVEALLPMVESSSLKEPLRLVRLSHGPVLKAKIPWRSFVTPMLAPMVHWNRAYAVYKEQENYKASSGRGSDDEGAASDGTVAVEFYVDTKDPDRYLEYALAFGDTSKLWDDVWRASLAETIAGHIAQQNHEMPPEEDGDGSPDEPILEDHSSGD